MPIFNENVPRETSRPGGHRRITFASGSASRLWLAIPEIKAGKFIRWNRVQSSIFNAQITTLHWSFRVTRVISSSRVDCRFLPHSDNHRAELPGHLQKSL